MISLDLTTRLIHRDALILILDKPAGLPVHAGPKGGRSYASQSRMSPSAAGAACTYKIRRLTVAAP